MHAALTLQHPRGGESLRQRLAGTHEEDADDMVHGRRRSRSGSHRRRGPRARAGTISTVSPASMRSPVPSGMDEIMLRTTVHPPRFCDLDRRHDDRFGGRRAAAPDQETADDRPSGISAYKHCEPLPPLVDVSESSSCSQSAARSSGWTPNCHVKTSSPWFRRPAYSWGWCGRPSIFALVGLVVTSYRDAERCVRPGAREARVVGAEHVTAVEEPGDVVGEDRQITIGVDGDHRDVDPFGLRPSVGSRSRTSDRSVVGQKSQGSSCTRSIPRSADVPDRRGARERTSTVGQIEGAEVADGRRRLASV